jgi:hypothetical protein
VKKVSVILQESDGVDMGHCGEALSVPASGAVIKKRNARDYRPNFKEGRTAVRCETGAESLS